MSATTKIEKLAGGDVLSRAEVIIDLYRTQGLKLTHFQYLVPARAWNDEIVMVFQGEKHE